MDHQRHTYNTLKKDNSESTLHKTHIMLLSKNCVRYERGRFTIKFSHKISEGKTHDDGATVVYFFASRRSEKHGF